MLLPFRVSLPIVSPSHSQSRLEHDVNINFEFREPSLLREQRDEYCARLRILRGFPRQYFHVIFTVLFSFLRASSDTVFSQITKQLNFNETDTIYDFNFAASNVND